MLTESYESHCHEGHQAAFCIVHEVSKPQPLLGLAANLALLALLVPLGKEGAFLPKMVQEILDN